MTELVCTCARIDGYRITRADCPIHPMPPRRPAHENPLRLTFTREELDEALAAARAEVARDMRTKIEAMADDHSLWAQHRPVVGKFAGMFAAVGCSCMDRVFVAGVESYAQHIAALLADGGEPQ